MEQDTEPEMHQAVEKNDIESLTKLLENGGDPNTRGFRGATPLHVAAREMHIDCVKILLQYGADPNALSMLGATPICWGMAEKVLDRFTGKIVLRTTPVNIEVLQLLVNAGADVKMKNSSLLHTAAGKLQQGNIAIAKFFIDNGLDPSGRDIWNKTPLGWAADHGSPEMAKFLVEKGSSIYALTTSLETPLCRAVRRAQDWETVDILLREHHKKQATNVLLNDQQLQVSEELETCSSHSNLPENCSSLSDLPENVTSNSLVGETAITDSSLNQTLTPFPPSLESKSYACNQTVSLLPTAEAETSQLVLKPSDGTVSQTSSHEENAVFLPVSYLTEEDRFDALISQERNYHPTDQDIRQCLRKGLGPNAITLGIIKRMSDMKPIKKEKSQDNKCMAYLKQHTPQRVVKWKRYIAQKLTQLKQRVVPPIKKVAPFLSGVVFCWVSYYVDFGMDILLAVERLYDNPGTVAIVLTWLFAFLPSIILNITLCYQRLSLFEEFQMDVVYKEHGFFKHFLIFYENKIAAISLCILQGWPALVYLQNYHINELPIHIIPNNVLTAQKASMRRTVRLVRQWEALLEATPMLFLQLWITLENRQVLTTTVALKLAMSIFSISFNLLKEEMLAKSVDLPVSGKIFLLLSLYLRTIARITSIVLFTYVLTFWIIPLYTIHVLLVIGLQIHDFKRHTPSAAGRPPVRVTEAFSSIFNYIPDKSYETNVSIYSRLAFLVFSFLEDVFMLTLVYFFLSDPPYGDDFILYCFGAYFGSILVSHVLLVVYYKAFHPWSWKVNLLPFFQSS